MSICFNASRFRTMALPLSGLLLLASLPGNAQTITLDKSDTGRTFDGIGAVSAGASSRLLIDYPEPQRSEILDYLFKPGYGAALQHLKVEVGSDVNSTDGSEPSSMRTPKDHDYSRGYEWWLMEEARKRNPHIILDVLPWGAPGWVGDGHIYSTNMAEYIVDFLRGAESAHHLHIDYVGIWNERMYDSNYVKTLAALLKKEGLDTKIVCCDSTPGTEFGEWSIIDAMIKDPALRQSISAVGVHYPRERLEPTPAQARTAGVPLWSSEDQPNSGGGPFIARTWNFGGKVLAKQYIANYLERGLTKTEIWSPITSYYDILAAPNSGLMYANTPWSGHYEVQSTIWATAHTTQFTAPGWQYMDRASGKLDADGSYVSLRSPDGGDWSVVLETVDARTPRTLHFVLKNGLSPAAVHVWQTDATHTFEKVADIAQSEGGFTYTFQPGALYSLTTTEGQGAHNAVIPPKLPFPFPYEEDFEKTAVGKSPRYLSDQDGAFEVYPCTGRPGNCLVQQITRTPIPWSPLPDPFTLAGGVEERDYTISSKVLIPQFGAVMFMGRIDSSDVFKDDRAHYPAGYILRLGGDGRWELLSTAYNKPTSRLAEGYLGGLQGTWHHVKLGFKEATISAWVDDKPLVTIDNWDHLSGFFGLGSSWDKAEFDDLKIKDE